MVSKKKSRAPLTPEYLQSLLRAKGSHALQNVTAALVRKASKHEATVLHSILVVQEFAAKHDVEVFAGNSAQHLADALLVEFDFMSTSQACVELFEFVVSMYKYAPGFEPAVHHMMSSIHLFMDDSARTRRVLQCLVAVAQLNLVPREKTFEELAELMQRNASTYGDEELTAVVIFLREVLESTTNDRHELNSYSSVVHRLRSLNSALCAILGGQKFAAGTKNSIFSYAVALLKSLPPCCHPSADAQRPPAVAHTRRLLLETALRLHQQHETFGIDSVLPEPALLLLYEFIHPCATHFVFTDGRVARCLNDGVASANPASKELAIRLSAILLNIVWHHFSEDADGAEVLGSPLLWMRGVADEVGAQVALLSPGMAFALASMPAALRQNVLELLNRFASEDAFGAVHRELAAAHEAGVFGRLRDATLSRLEQIYVDVLTSTLSLEQLMTRS